MGRRQTQKKQVFISADGFSLLQDLSSSLSLTLSPVVSIMNSRGKSELRNGPMGSCGDDSSVYEEPEVKRMSNRQ